MSNEVTVTMGLVLPVSVKLTIKVGDDFDSESDDFEIIAAELSSVQALGPRHVEEQMGADDRDELDNLVQKAIADGNG